MASAAPVTSSTKETTNYARLCRLLVDIGTQALRDTLNAIHAPANLHTVLAANTATLQSLKAKRIINATQWGKLFPAIPNSVSSSNFDTTLLMVLLRNLCGLTTPPTGWDALPAVTDLSKEADIARVKFFRNTVYGHAEKASVDDIKFNDYWRDIRDTLIRLGGASYQAAIDTLRNETMDPDVEDHYMGLLSEWKKDEDNVKEELGAMKKMQEKIVRGQEKIVHGQEKMLQALTPSKEVADQVTALHEIKLKVLPKDLDAEKHEILNQHFTTYISIFMKNNKLSSMEGMGEFLKYIEDSYNLLTRALGCGCLEIRVQCRNMESLERLWRDCCHGNLDRMAERCLVTNELIKKLDLKALRLNVVIKEEDYLACKESFSDVVGPLKEVSSSVVIMDNQDEWMVIVLTIVAFFLNTGRGLQATKLGEEFLIFLTSNARIKEYHLFYEEINLLMFDAAYKVSNYTSAERYAKELLIIYHTSGDTLREGRVSLVLGMIYQKQNKFERAREYYQKAAVVTRSTGDKQTEALCYMMIGKLFNSLCEYHKAEEYYKKALTITVSNGD
ncbi:uncharacterized protein LOC111347506, partial [Stylophora pistillata]|uniref:uncharacterized protein LOC111347506 n=1 Tax=Stylophora pistillata TaxID=50429 RepID=UPI000C0525CB